MDHHTRTQDTGNLNLMSGKILQMRHFVITMVMQSQCLKLSIITLLLWTGLSLFARKIIFNMIMLMNRHFNIQR